MEVYGGINRLSTRTGWGLGLVWSGGDGGSMVDNNSVPMVLLCIQDGVEV
jgi:hypothetical protein